MSIGRKCPSCGQDLSDHDYEKALKKAMTPAYHDGGPVCRVCGKNQRE
jgi:hypothetical protein